MKKEHKFVRIELTDEQHQPPSQPAEGDNEEQELEIAELEPRITPTSVNASADIGFFL